MFPIAPDQTDLFLGPGVVRSVGATGDVEVAVAHGVVSATMALPMPYQPAVEDELLIVGQADRHYVIGVLQSQATATYTFPGNVTVAAPNGSITVEAKQAVETQAEEIETRAGRITLIAESFTQKLGSLYRWVKGLVHIRGGRKHAVYEGTVMERAERIHRQADEDVKVSGKRVHLG